MKADNMGQGEGPTVPLQSDAPVLENFMVVTGGYEFNVIGIEEANGSTMK